MKRISFNTKFLLSMLSFSNYRRKFKLQNTKATDKPQQVNSKIGFVQKLFLIISIHRTKHNRRIVELSKHSNRSNLQRSEICDYNYVIKIFGFRKFIFYICCLLMKTPLDRQLTGLSSFFSKMDFFIAMSYLTFLLL